MNKKLDAYFTENGFKVNGNEAYGFIRNYETNVYFNALVTSSPLKFHISFYANEEQKNKIAEELKLTNIKYLKYEFTKFGVIIGLSAITWGKVVENLPEIQNKIYSILSSSGVLGKGHCACCGKEIDEENSKLCKINSFDITLSNECIIKENNAIQQANEDFKNAPNNYLKGFVGALIGALVGTALSVILYLIGYVSFISSMVGILLGAFLYAKFGGKENKMMLVIVGVTTIVCLVISHFVTYIVTAGITANNLGYNMGAFEAFSYVMEDAVVSRAFYTDLVLLLVFAIVGIILELVYLSKKIKRKTSI